jgi:alpha-aminoadipate carrier protein LysW
MGDEEKVVGPQRMLELEDQKRYVFVYRRLQMAECPICGGTVNLGEDTVQGELIACTDCGSELEVTGVNPFTLAEAPKEEEDWGE